MTDDLVARLRFRSTPTSVDDRAICYEAADEIERLRHELWGRSENFDDACTTLAKVEAERDEWKGMANRQQDQNKRLFFENATLRALLAEAVKLRTEDLERLHYYPHYDDYLKRWTAALRERS